VTVLDKRFTGFVPEQPKCEWLIVHKCPKAGHISKEENKKIKKINLVPYPIKNKLDDFSSRFTILSVKYQHKRKWFTPLLHFDVALHNLIANYLSSSHNFNETWESPIFKEKSENKTENAIGPFKSTDFNGI